MAEFLMKPKIDFAFKEIMMDEKARTGFLAAVLKLQPEGIKETQILNTSLRKEHEDDKQGILDVRLLLNSDQEVDIEIQLSELAVWADRSLFYLAKMFTGQIKPGQGYRVFKKCVGISILDFILFKDPSPGQGGGAMQGTQGSIPASISGRTPAISFTPTRWSSTSSSCQSSQRNSGKTAAASSFGLSSSTQRARRNST